MIQRHLRVVFMGTPYFAVVSLQFLVEAGYPVVGVITAPDKLGGRGMKQVIASPVKQFAQEHGLRVLQPTNLKSKAFLEELRNLQADIQVVVAFRMLPEPVWSMPPHGTLNLHGSLLPAYRGAAPLQWAIIRGEKTTGVTTFRLQHEIDTGLILQQREIPILDSDDAGSLHDRMMYVGASLVISTLDQLSEGNSSGIKQDDSRASQAPKIHHEDGQIFWSKTATEVNDLIRAMSPFPGAWTVLDGIVLKIWKARVYSHDSMGTPGRLKSVGKTLLVNTAIGEIELVEVQLEGKKRMNIRDFINGYKIKDPSLT